MDAPEYNRIKCVTCGHVATYLDRGHYCMGNLGLLTAYQPNIGRVTRNADPQYRKHAGSRAKRFRRPPAWMLAGIDEQIAKGI